jgi:para-aminobenzoate synthetase component 1
MRSTDNFVAREFTSFSITDRESFKAKMLSWANQFNICCLLDNHEYRLPHHTYDCILAVGAINVFKPNEDFFGSLSQYYSNTNDWILGHFSYDIKNKIENLTSSNLDQVSFPETFLFVPEVVVLLEAE